MRHLFTLVILLLLFAVNASAQVNPVPDEMHFQGRLTKPDGTPVADGTHWIRFSLWDREVGGNEIWSEGPMPVTTRNGVFSAYLTNLETVFFSAQLWMEIKIGSDPPLTPRQWLLTVPYAFKADSIRDNGVTSDSIEDGTIRAEDIADGTITASKLVGGGVSPIGAAGGDLSGTYPNPTLASKLSSLQKVSGGALRASLAAYSLDQSQTATSGSLFQPNWQSFTAGVSGYLTRLEISGKTVGSSPQTITINIRSGEGSGGQILATQTMAFTSTDTYHVCTFTTASTVFLNAGSKYTIELTNTNNTIHVNMKQDDSYAGGRCSNSPTIDWQFRTYMTPRVSFGVNITNPAGQLHLPYVGSGQHSILIGAASDVGSGNHAELMIAQPANASGHWPINVTRGGTLVYAVREDGSVLSASSRRYKENIAPLPDMLERVLKMQPVTFDWKPEFGGKRDIGFVAEDLGAVLPELVEWDTNGKDALGVRYDRLGVLAIEAIKEQQKQMTTLQAENAALKQQLTNLTELVQQIKAAQESRQTQPLHTR